MEGYSFITELRWEPMVGRKNPPLRVALTLEGLIDWFEKRFGERLSNPVISFGRFTNSGIESDNYLNVSEKKLMGKLLKKAVDEEYESVVQDLEHFSRVTDQLEMESKKLGGSSRKLEERFSQFIELWRNFSPVLAIPIFLEKTIEREVLANFEDEDEAHEKLMGLVSSGVKSELFETHGVKKVDSEYFQDVNPRYLEILKILMSMRDRRKSVYETAWYESTESFFRELGEVTGFGEYIEWVGPDKIRLGLSSGGQEANYEYQSLVYTKNGEVHVDYSDDFSTLQELVDPSRGEIELKGRPAFKGKVRGKVKKIMPNDRKKMDEEAVLVTKMTTPDFVPLLNRCLAIVTNEGGVTCHAAIVSREFEIPCIVGTGKATKTLSDGDVVEVDAEKGIVRKID